VENKKRGEGGPFLGGKKNGGGREKTPPPPPLLRMSVIRAGTFLKFGLGSRLL